MRLPKATYRIQFTPDFGFSRAREIVDYLARLGISDLYASPIFRARQGSLHGYDVLDPTELNAELGSREEFERLSDAVREQGMGWLQDIVPNHMAFDGENPYLTDILENGPSSRYYKFFDIDWSHYYQHIRGKLLTPFLGGFFGEVLESGELTLQYEERGFAARYYEWRFPLRIESYLQILTACVAPLRKQLGEDHPDYIQLLGVLYVLKTLVSDQPGEEDGRYDQVRFIKQTLWNLYRGNGAITERIDAELAQINGTPGSPESFNRLESLLSDQHFRLSFWKVATEEINYRRFFSINDLISLRMEHEKVFARTHQLVCEMVKKGRFTGLRIDHIDGLYDPDSYLRRLRQAAGKIYLVVEKILEATEALPSWPIEGSTGYDFMNWLNDLFCRRENEKAFTKVYTGFCGVRTPYAELVYAKKKLIIEKHMFGDINNLANMLKNIAGRYRYGSDITMDSLKRALIEVLALFPVYRSYLGSGEERDSDPRYIREAVDQARERSPGLKNELDYIGRTLLLEFEEFLPESERRQWLHFVMRFQQFTGPLMAKGFEDTLLYGYNRLISLNEVGGSPERFGADAAAFHGFSRERQAQWPHGMNATATHDTKRGEDVRARINVLSEIPQEWGRQVRSWSRINRHAKGKVKRRSAPDRNDEYFFYQTLVGAYPFYQEECPEFIERIKEYLVKAVREAKIHTAWLKPDTDYEDAFVRFAEEVLRPCEQGSNPFLKEFLPFQRRVAHYGIFNSLAQTLIKVTAPGIPDFYQGTEFWDFSLVDPDNRRPVDFESRSAALDQIEERAEGDLPGLLSELLNHPGDGRIKLFLIQRALELRRSAPELFTEGTYRAVGAEGPAAEHLFAHLRSLGDRHAVTVVPRFLTGLIEEGELPLGERVWGDTTLHLPGGKETRWRDAFTGNVLCGGGKVPAAEILSRFPVALLTTAVD